MVDRVVRDYNLGLGIPQEQCSPHCFGQPGCVPRRIGRPKVLVKLLIVLGGEQNVNVVVAEPLLKATSQKDIQIEDRYREVERESEEPESNTRDSDPPSARDGHECQNKPENPQDVREATLEHMGIPKHEYY